MHWPGTTGSRRNCTTNWRTSPMMTSLPAHWRQLLTLEPSWKNLSGRYYAIPARNLISVDIAYGVPAENIAIEHWQFGGVPAENIAIEHWQSGGVPAENIAIEHWQFGGVPAENIAIEHWQFGGHPETSCPIRAEPIPQHFECTSHAGLARMAVSGTAQEDLTPRRDV